MRAERTPSQWNQKAREYLETHMQSGSTVPKRFDAREPERLWFSEADPQCWESGFFQKGAAPDTACSDGANPHGRQLGWVQGLLEFPLANKIF